MLNLTRAADSALALIEDTIGDCIFFVGRCFRRVCQNQREKFVLELTLILDQAQFLHEAWTQARSRTAHSTPWSTNERRLSCTENRLATIVLTVPVIVLSNITSSAGRLITIALSAGLFLTAVSLFTKARTVEIFAAGAR
jgi:hypothetical protein